MRVLIDCKTFCRCTEYQDIDSGEIVGYRDNDASCQRFYEYVAAECLLRTASGIQMNSESAVFSLR